jgi:uncharacterized membrane protein YdjX (TVP38/TMEM64 family)
MRPVFYQTAMTKTTVARAAALLVLGGGVVALLFFFPVKEWLVAFVDWVRGLGPWGPVAIGAAYIPACLLFLPGSPLTLGAGFAFGVVRGTIAVSIGSTLGAAAAFWAGRTLLRGLIEERVARNPRFQAIDQAVAEQGAKIVLLTRLSPVFPFNLLNYAFGVTKVRFRDYILASWIGMLPGTIMYVYLGSAAGSLADLVAGNVEGGAGQQALIYVGLAATVAVTILVTRIARRALAKAVPRVADELVDSSVDRPPTTQPPTTEPPAKDSTHA